MWVGNKILAIDPGPSKSAFVLLEKSTETICYCKIVENNALLGSLRAIVADNLVIEMIASYGMPVGKETFDTCVWIGRYIQASHIPVTIVFRKEIVTELCGSSRAKDSNIRQALIDIWGQPGTKKSPGKTYGISNDMWAALAVGTYFLRKYGRN